MYHFESGKFERECVELDAADVIAVGTGRGGYSRASHSYSFVIFQRSFSRGANDSMDQCGIDICTVVSQRSSEESELIGLEIRI